MDRKEITISLLVVGAVRELLIAIGGSSMIYEGLKFVTSLLMIGSDGLGIYQFFSSLSFYV